MKTRIMTLVMMIFLSGVTTAQGGTLPVNYESVVLTSKTLKYELDADTFYRVHADGQVDSYPSVVPGGYRLMITEFSVYTNGAPAGTALSLHLNDQIIAFVEKPREAQSLNYNMPTGFAVAPGAKLKAHMYDLYGEWFIILRGYLTAAKKGRL